ncbi:hypothetical protein [Acinetobacter towneri]|uniref:hypothetical protein n=1 Tax=Acinetobacter towneri TaxID=202956 RepID=UPI001F60D9A4|nr:hypothetical protein [Acinetobacter towneri]UNT61170.1 hypothetical protein IHE36_09480 [Acinetobacter towneri]
MSREQSIPSFEYGYVSYHTAIEKLIHYIAWIFIIFYLIVEVVILKAYFSGKEIQSNTDYPLLWSVFFLALAFLFTRIRITYRLDSQSFSRAVTPARVFGWLNKSVNFSEKGFKYIRLTRTSNINGGHYYGPACFLAEIGQFKDFGVFTHLWHDMILLDCYQSLDASSVYDFALEVQKLTGLEIVIDPQWADAYKR